MQHCRKGENGSMPESNWIGMGPTRRRTETLPHRQSRGSGSQSHPPSNWSDTRIRRFCPSPPPTPPPATPSVIYIGASTPPPPKATGFSVVIPNVSFLIAAPAGIAFPSSNSQCDIPIPLHPIFPSSAFPRGVVMDFAVPNALIADTINCSPFLSRTYDILNSLQGKRES